MPYHFHQMYPNFFYEVIGTATLFMVREGTSGYVPLPYPSTRYRYVYPTSGYGYPCNIGRNQVSKDIEEVIEANCGFVEKIMDSIYKSKFWTKCPYCEMEFLYLRFFKNGNRSCPICGKFFIMKDDQGN